MTAYQTALTIDFGEVGHWNSKQPFRVRLDAKGLAELISHAENAHRVYELMLIDRPGDVWDYVWVVIEEVPSRLVDRVEHAREEAKPRHGSDHPWPDRQIPFTVFDDLFYWAWDDTEPEDETWLNHRESPTMHAFSQQLLAMVRAAQGRLEWSDPLLRHEVARVRSGDHPYHYLARGVAIAKGREHRPNSPTHTAAFYAQLQQLLRDPDLTSVAYRADGDYRVLRMMATEQRRRANKSGHSVGHAMHLSALVNNTVSNEAWDAEIWFFEEGLAHGDLFIEGGGLGGGNLKALVEKHHRVPGRFILATQDEGHIEGFDIESGDGWVLYRKQNPDSRRRGLEMIESRRSNSRLGPVLKFEGEGTTLFEYDKTVAVVGEGVGISVRTALAAVMVEWQNHGGDPVLVVLGDISPFEMVGCRDLLQPTRQQDLDESISDVAWLSAVLRQARPWIDVIIALDAPVWATQVLANRVRHSENPWSPWVVASSSVEHLIAHLTLEGDLARGISEAHQRAQTMRPNIL